MEPAAAQADAQTAHPDLVRKRRNIVCAANLSLAGQSGGDCLGYTALAMKMPA